MAGDGAVPVEPSAAVLAVFGIRVVAPLGGRLNRHWLVARGGERFVLRRWHQPIEDVGYELRLLAAVAALGWPVATVSAGPVELDGAIWSLFPYLPGEPPSLTDAIAEQRERGRLLATFHADLAQIEGLGQRDGWRRCEEILGDPALDRILAEHERARTEEVRALRWHLDRARERIAGLRPGARPGQLIHGDFTPWNLRFRGGKLSGILDFEQAHLDHRIADFALSWRGKHDAIIHGYNEVAPLDPEEWALLTPMWWALLIEGACHDLVLGQWGDDWAIVHLLRRSPLMGPDAGPYG